MDLRDPRLQTRDKAMLQVKLPDGRMDTVYCEQCGDTEAEIILKYANLCGPCAADVVSGALSDVYPYPICGQPLWLPNGLLAVCTVKAGTEHDHG